ncbi:hypothetical protein I6E29_02180 [Arcanobacterium haemolyticum]|nr:hypothetical protein [Arcanobacterium haemolyticum]
MVNPENAARRNEILQVCELTYVRGWTQQRIAAHTGFSRWKVARLVEAGLKEGFVSIRVRDPFARDHQLETELARRYALDEVVVVRDRMSLEATVAEVSAQAARILEQIRPNPEIVGLSWGRTLAEVSHHISDGWADSPLVVQLNGGVANLRNATSAQSILTFARKAQGEALVLPCPAIVGNADLARALSDDRAVKDVLDKGRQANVALYSLGALRADSVHVESGCLTRQEVSYLRARGGVGDILGHFLGGTGEIVDEALDSRTIGLAPHELRDMEYSIAVAVGRQKGAVTRAALLGKYANILVTSQSTAHEVLAD